MGLHFSPSLARHGDNVPPRYKSPLPPPSLILMPLLSKIRALRQGDSSATSEYPVAQFLHLLPAPSPLEVRSQPAPESDGVPPCQHYARIVQDLRSCLPSTCHWLGPEDVNIASERPMAAGGFADIYEATYGGRQVVLKVYRCYVSFDVAQVAAVRCNHSLCR